MSTMSTSAATRPTSRWPPRQPAATSASDRRLFAQLLGDGGGRERPPPSAERGREPFAGRRGRAPTHHPTYVPGRPEAVVTGENIGIGPGRNRWLTWLSLLPGQAETFGCRFRAETRIRRSTGRAGKAR